MTLQTGTWNPRSQPCLGLVDFEISVGTSWMSLNDHLNYQLTDDSFSERSQTRRRETVTSVFYDGTYETHSVLENVSEGFGLYVVGGDQNQVTENQLALEDWFTQISYNLRLTMDNHRETWLCMPAEWSIDRSQIQAHNVRLTVKLTVPRFPKVSYEVIS